MHNIESQPTQISNRSQYFKIKSLPTIIVFKLHYSTSCNILSIYLFWFLTIKCGSCTKLKIYSTITYKSNWQFGYFFFTSSFNYLINVDTSITWFQIRHKILLLKLTFPFVKVCSCSLHFSSDHYNL
jgi:hypothetical protein